MHLLFFLYGSRLWVETLLRDMEAQKFKLPMRKGKEKKYMWVQGQIRQTPFGYEYVFPKEYLNIILTTLDMKHTPYNLSKLQFFAIRKLMRLKKIPIYSEEERFIWLRDNISILTLGIREDGEYTDPSGEHKGWTHEAL